jgi:integrase
MGQTASLPAVRTSDIGRTAAEFARHSRAPATESAYASDWADFTAWCVFAERLALPADPVTIGAYLSDRSGILKVSTLNRRLAAITAMHRLGGHGLDGKHPAIALVLAGIRRTYSTRQIAKRALLTEDLRRIVRRLRIDTPGGCRDRALLLVCFGAAMRRSEFIALDVDDITITQAGLTLLVRRSKTDQEGQGREQAVEKADADCCRRRRGRFARRSACCRRRSPTPRLAAYVVGVHSAPGTSRPGLGQHPRAHRSRKRLYHRVNSLARVRRKEGIALQNCSTNERCRVSLNGPEFSLVSPRAVHQPDTDRLGDEVHPAEGARRSRSRSCCRQRRL